MPRLRWFAQVAQHLRLCGRAHILLDSVLGGDRERMLPDGKRSASLVVQRRFPVSFQQGSVGFRKYHIEKHSGTEEAVLLWESVSGSQISGRDF